MTLTGRAIHHIRTNQRFAFQRLSSTYRNFVNIHTYCYVISFVSLQYYCFIFCWTNYQYASIQPYSNETSKNLIINFAFKIPSFRNLAGTITENQEWNNVDLYQVENGSSQVYQQRLYIRCAATSERRDHLGSDAIFGAFRIGRKSSTIAP